MLGRLLIPDGFGTYDDETQAAAVMSHIGSRGYFWFLIFQLFVNGRRRIASDDLTC